MKSLGKKIAILVIRFYQVAISPLFPSCCRFTPSCSEYAKIAIERFGLKEGGKLAIKRISKCRPHSDYGYDPVPERL
ncbi:MAG: membrane protein insertion efficiency factor YidD [Phoenicibacter congonensis]|uniref:Putative membrane protein insertion efficiency factor n=1 Tax=Phoenicibacter congonensis TaxID=1944646 RepID=A0AA43U5F0_9ACTN|nr:membrane protein insertion efficiency factor YidD [Phoenicibacter congonensis]